MIIEARLERDAFRFTVASQDENGAVLPFEVADPVLEWLFTELLADAGGSFAKTTIGGVAAAVRFEIPRQRPVGS